MKVERYIRFFFIVLLILAVGDRVVRANRLGSLSADKSPIRPARPFPPPASS